jgi:hypothetical protein
VNGDRGAFVSQSMQARLRAIARLMAIRRFETNPGRSLLARASSILALLCLLIGGSWFIAGPLVSKNMLVGAIPAIVLACLGAALYGAALYARSRREWLLVGTDGLLHRRGNRGHFVPIGVVRSVRREDVDVLVTTQAKGEVIIELDQPPHEIVISSDDPDQIATAIDRARSAAARLRAANTLARSDSTPLEQWAESLEKLGSSYRGSPDTVKLRDAVRDPLAAPRDRAIAARALIRVRPDAAEEIVAIAEDSLSDDARAELLEAASQTAPRRHGIRRP